MKPNVWVSASFSLLALVLMAMHLVQNSLKVEALDGGLLLLAFIPWGWTIFKSVKVTGIAEFEYRELKQTVDRQDNEIRALRFVVANFLTGRQFESLSKFSEEGPVHISDDDDNARRFQVIGELRALGFLAPKGDWNELATIGWDGDLSALFAITDLGREYLEVRASANSSA
jgi:Ca2+/Na+ antiporter